MSTANQNARLPVAKPSTSLPTRADHLYCRKSKSSSVLVKKQVSSTKMAPAPLKTQISSSEMALAPLELQVSSPEMEDPSDAQACQSSLQSSSLGGDRITTLKDVEANLYALTKLVTNVAAEVRLVFDVVCGGTDTIQRSCKLPRVENVENLKELNEKLGNNSLYMAELVTKCLHLLKLENDVDRRLCIMLDLIFDREFLGECSWTGQGFVRPKVRFCEFVHVLCLFRIAGGNSFIKLTDDFIKHFFNKKLYNVKSRLQNYKPTEGTGNSRKRRLSE